MHTKLADTHQELTNKLKESLAETQQSVENFEKRNAELEKMLGF